MDNQNHVLRNIRQALMVGGGGVRSKKLVPNLFVSHDPTPILDAIRSREKDIQSDLIDLFCRNCIELQINTFRADSITDAQKFIVDLLRSKEVEFGHNKHVIQHDHELTNNLQLWKKFPRESITVHTSFDSDLQIREKSIESFIGITVPEIGIAELASIIEISGPGQPRLTSLLPSIHIALLEEKKIVADLDEAFCLLQSQGNTNHFTIITGPSKTADIEAQLVTGAHGPKELYIILLP